MRAARAERAYLKLCSLGNLALRTPSTDTRPRVIQKTIYMCCFVKTW